MKSRHSRRAFSLIEVVGLLAVLAILAGTLVPVVIQGYDRSARSRESDLLDQIGAGLRGHILRNRSIPDAASFASAVATELGWSLPRVTHNERGLPRVLLIDPDLTNLVSLPFNQPALGVTGDIRPSLGVLLLSSLSTPLPASITNGFAASTNDFQAVWNTPEGSIPAGWNWTGRGEDLRIHRLNIGALFVPLILNYDTYTVSVTNQGRFSIDGSTTNVLPTSPTYITHFLAGSVLGLHHHQGAANTLQVREVLQHPLSFVYERDAWRGQLFLGRGFRPTTGLDIQAAHDLFIASPENVNAQAGASPVTVILAVSNYLAAYVTWETSGYPPFGPLLDAVKDAQDDMEDITMDLLHKPSGGGSK